MSKTVDFFPVSSFGICFIRKSPTLTPTMLKICFQGLFFIANNMAIKFFPNSNFLVFLGIIFETHHNQNEINAVLERLPKDSMHLEFFLVTWLMERRGKRLKWTDYKYESINMKANSNHSVAYDVREYPPLILHKIPKNFQFKDK